MSRFLTHYRGAVLVVAVVASSIPLGAAGALAQSDPTPLSEDTGPLVAGTYVDTSTGPSIVFSVGDDWVVSGEPLSGVGTELVPVGFDGALTLTTFDGNVFSAPCAAKGQVDKLLKKTTAIDVNATSFIEAMAAHDSLVAQPIVETELGGLPALQLDVVALPNKKCEPRTAFLWELPIVREFHLNHGAIARIIAADVGDEVVIALIETPGQTGASPFAFLDKATELVETIEATPAAADGA